MKKKKGGKKRLFNNLANTTEEAADISHCHLGAAKECWCILTACTSADPEAGLG